MTFVRKEIIGDCVLYLGDSLSVLNEISGVSAVVTDPPYELGFMGKGWDQTGIANNVDLWRLCLNALKPGGHLLSFGGSRTYHRMACAVEDAGFEVRDQIMWLYGSGMPKSHNIGNKLEEWQGWGTALKPAHEPLVLARKPLVGTVAANVQEFGTGALNIDDCRVSVGEGGRPKREVAAMRDDVEYNGNALVGRVNGSLQSSKAVGSTNQGRWPANVIHDGSEEVVAAFPESAGALAPVKSTEPSGVTNGIYGKFSGRVASEVRADSGSAARFFYCAKASKADRNEGLEHMPDAVLARSCQAIAEANRNNTVSTSGGAFNKARVVKNNHPTVKPTDLMRYLCRLVTPPDGIVLDPFMGSGSTGKAAALEGFRFIGIEQQPEYFEIACERIRQAKRAYDDEKSKAKQMNLF